MTYVLPNLFFLIPVAIYIAIWLFRFLRKARREDLDPGLIAADDAFRGADENEVGTGTDEDRTVDEFSPIMARLTSGEDGRSPAPAKKSAEPDFTLTPDFLAEKSDLETSGGQRNADDTSGARRKYSFPLEGLSPMKKAVAWAEILGPPKGM